MAYPEKVERNERVYYNHLTGASYRTIQKQEKLESVKDIYRIVSRMRVRHKNAKAFMATYEKAHKDLQSK